MKLCACMETHERLRIVLTGGPGAGKTAVLELIRQSFCRHVKVLPEAAGVVFSGGFPRADNAQSLRAAQRAIFFVQRELEAAGEADDPAVVLCDRGTVDGAAYWPGPGDLWSSVGATFSEQLKRYDAVIHMRTPTLENGYNKDNPLRIESVGDAAAIDDRIGQLWKQHPRCFVVEASKDFLDKARRVLELLRAEMPECCRRHVVPLVDRVSA